MTSLPSSSPPERTARSSATASADDLFSFALRIGESLLRNGASSEVVTRALLALARTNGYPDCTVNVTMGQITLGYVPTETLQPVTLVKNVGSVELDIPTLTAIEDLVGETVTGRVGVLEAFEKLNFIIDHGRSPLTLRLMGAFLMAMGFAWLLGADLAAALVAAATAVLTEFLSTGASRIMLPPFYARVLSSVLAVGAASLALALTPLTQPGVVITASIVTQLVGSASVSAVQDLLTGWLLTACGRLIEAALLTTGLVVGTMGGLTLAEKAGRSLELTAVQPALDLSQTSVAAVLIAAGYAVYCQAGPRSIILFSLLGALGHLVYTVSDRSGVSGMSSTAAAATVLGILTVLLARPMNWPASGALDIAVIPLVPGMAFYQALAGFVNHDANAAAHLFEGLATSIAIGAGAVLGQFVSSRVLWQARRAQVNHLAKRDGTSIAEAEFEAQGLTTPDFRRPFHRQA